MTNQNNAAQAANENPLSDEYVNAIIQRHGYDSPETVIARLAQWIGLNGGEDGVTLLMYEAYKALVKLRAPVADEHEDFEAWRKHALPWTTPATTGISFAWDAWQARAAPASAPVSGEAQRLVAISAQHSSGALSMDGASLHMQPDGSGKIIVTEEDFTLEDDRGEGPDGPQGSVHWVARLPASEIAALRDFLTGHARPSDDTLWDQALTERDEYHDMADKLANAIADHLLVEIGEHSSSNCPWMRALEAIENAAPQASKAVPTEPMRVFSAGMWTYDGTGQAFSHTELDEAAFVTYRAALSAQPSGNPGKLAARPGAQKEQSDAN